MHCTLPVVLHVGTDVSVTVASNILVKMELKKNVRNSAMLYFLVKTEHFKHVFFVIAMLGK